MYMNLNMTTSLHHVLPLTDYGFPNIYIFATYWIISWVKRILPTSLITVVLFSPFKMKVSKLVTSLQSSSFLLEFLSVFHNLTFTISLTHFELDMKWIVSWDHKKYAWKLNGRNDCQSQNWCLDQKTNLINVYILVKQMQTK